MEWFYLYIFGCIVDSALIGLHAILGYLSIAPYMKSNYEKIGTHLSYMGYACGEPGKIRNLVFDVFMSWFAVVFNVVSLAIRAYKIIFVTRTAPKEILDINYRLQYFDLTVEEVICLTLKMKNAVSGLKFTEEEIVMELKRSEEKLAYKPDMLKLLDLLKEHGLIKAKSA